MWLEVAQGRAKAAFQVSAVFSFRRLLPESNQLAIAGMGHAVTLRYELEGRCVIGMFH